MVFKVRNVVGGGGQWLETAHPGLSESGQYVVLDLDASYTRVFALWKIHRTGT